MHTTYDQARTTDHAALISASTVKDTAVYGHSGDKLGTIDDVMIGKRDGTVAYAIMSFGGFLGIGEKFHPLPWHMLDYDTDLDGYRVPLDGDRLKDAPNYSREELASTDWEQETNTHYARSTSPGVRTASMI